MKEVELDEKIRKVGRKYENKDQPFSYRDVQTLDGWADVSLYIPGDFDLVLLKMDNGKVRSGWSTGTGWDGLRLQDDEKILYWKRKDYDD